jgi:hypothetical protein
VEFVEKTFAGSPEELEEVAQHLMTIRGQVPPPAAPFTAYIAHGEYHSRYDGARVHADLIEQALELADAA